MEIGELDPVQNNNNIMIMHVNVSSDNTLLP